MRVLTSEVGVGVLALQTSNGARYMLPALLSEISTYVVLEQERWFEKETAFVEEWLKPGMTVVEVGANVGMYAIPMAMRVAPNGKVFAFEPGTNARTALEKNAKLNGLSSLHIVASALSNRSGTAHLSFGSGSETSRLGEASEGAGEAVVVSTLDDEAQRLSWPSPDFVKIDAEGEEERIVAGGRRFFAHNSPLVMFEIRDNQTIHTNLLHLFRERGYDTYRWAPGLQALVPVLPDEVIDSFELNLFAAKPDRAARLEADGFLVHPVPWAPNRAARSAALQVWTQQPFAASLPAGFGDPINLDWDYRDALAAFAVWHGKNHALRERHGALAFALDKITALVRRAPSLARLSTAARIAAEFGRRDQCVDFLRLLFSLYYGGQVSITEPFWPAHARFDAIDPGEKWRDWFVTATMEQMEYSATFSNRFAPSSVDLDWVCTLPFASEEMERRRVLRRAWEGKVVAVPPRLLRVSANHVNADVWAEGGIPNTVVEDTTPQSATS